MVRRGDGVPPKSTAAPHAPVNRHDQVQDRRLTAEGVSMVVKRAAERLDPARYAGHSLARCRGQAQLHG